MAAASLLAAAACDASTIWSRPTRYSRVTAVSVPPAPLDSLAVSGVEGTWATDDTLTISGTEFGVKGVAGPVLWDTVVNQAAYSSIDDDDEVPVQDDDCAACPYENHINPAYGNVPLFETEAGNVRVVGEYAYRLPWKSYFKHTDMGAGGVPYFYANWWFRSTSDEIHLDSNKFIRVWDADYVGNARTSWTGMHLTRRVDPDHDGENDTYPEASETSGINWGGVVNQWNNLEMMIDSSGDISHGYGTLLARINCEDLHDVDCWAPTPYNYMEMIGMDSAGEELEDDDHYIASIYVDSVFARVVVADAADYDEITHAEIQIPLAWSDDEITILVNRGSLPDSVGAWLYVFDRANNHSDGFQVYEP